MLLQFRALEAATADTPQGRHETGRGEQRRLLKPVRNMVEESGSQDPVTRPVRAYTEQINVSVFVLDRSGKPLMPCNEKRARKLLQAGRARVHRLYPFAIRLVDISQCDCRLQPLRLSLDPGSKVTGLCIARVEPSVDGEPVMHIRFLMDLTHRGAQIRNGLHGRARLRRSRRGRNTRYRAPRFLNRTRPQGWLAPSLQHRIDTTTSWVGRLFRLAPITRLAQELVCFDMQLIQAQADGREIDGADYQRGTLAGVELGEYLLAKWGRVCAYCDAQGVPLEKDHIVPRAKGGSNRASNLALSCRPCNQKKAALDLKVFLATQPQRFARIQAQAKAPLRDAAAVNSTRWVLFQRLKSTGMPVESASGGLTKFNRVRLGAPKTHALDAACVGKMSEVQGLAMPALHVKCNGRGSRKRTRCDAFGFPKGYLMSAKSVQGFRTGDMVRAVIASGKKIGTHTGRVAIRASGKFNIQTPLGVVQGVHHKHCKVLMRGDGYSYSRVSKADSHKGKT